MSISLLHLSDIHFINGRNISFNRKQKLFDAIKNEIIGSDCCIILTSGDIANSGKKEEYKIALEFYKFLFQSIKSYTKLESKVIFVPGNHDCYFNPEKEKVRSLVLKDFVGNGFKELDDSLVEVCCEPQANFFQFVNDIDKRISHNGDIVFDHPLLKIRNFRIDDKIIKFNFYNSSWHSTLKEKIGNLGYPIEYLYDQIPSIESSLSVSVVHHPFNWQTQETSKPFREAIVRTSDILITGHEHQKNISIVSDLGKEFETIHIESDALQVSDNERKSSFNLIKIDLDEAKIKFKTFSYDTQSASYKKVNETDWKKIEKEKKLKSKPFQLKQVFLDDLDNPGATFSHSTADEIKLKDIYVPPYFNDLSVSKEKPSKFISFKNSSELLDINDHLKTNNGKSFYKMVLGNESSGKTALLKYIFLKYYEEGFYPVYIPAESISEIVEEKFKSLILKQLAKQYDELDEKFENIDFNKIVLLIDDFHRYKHKRSRPILLKTIQKIFSKCVITGNELMHLEYYTNKEDERIDLFDAFDRYMIQEFGPTLRNQLITKWYRLGKEYLENGEKNEFFKKIDAAEENVSSIIGKNLIPAFPIYILSILQAMESGMPDSSSNNLHGYYYEMLITRALKRTLTVKEDIGFYITLAKEFFYFLFKEKIRFTPISKEDFYKFFLNHCNKYTLTNINMEHSLNTLVDARIVDMTNEGFVSVSYKYIYYYFIAKYLSDNIEEDECRDIIEKMSERLYRDEYSNIFLFLTHLSKNKFIVDQLIEKSRKIFSVEQPVKLEDDVDFINVLQKSLPEKVIDNLNVEEARSADLIEKEEYEAIEKEFEEDKKNYEGYDLLEDINSLDVLAQITKALRTLNILGHITRKYWGEMLGGDKMLLAEETYMLGLRTLSYYFSLLNDNTDELIEHISRIINRKYGKQKLSKTDIENVATNVIFSLSSSVTYSIVKRVTNSIGTEKLSKTFDDLEEKHPYNSIKLINASIKLEHFNGFPEREIENLKNENEKNPLGFNTLQNMIINYLYMFEVPYARKQLICSKLNIRIQDQRYIGATSQIKKV